MSDRTEDLIYLAGYFDGEGCVCVSKPDGNALIAIKAINQRITVCQPIN